MKIQFDDQSFIQCKKSDNSNEIIVIISAKDQNNNLKKITNAVSLTVEQFNSLISDVT